MKSLPSLHASVLLVDDNVDAAKTLRMLLVLNRHEVQLAYDGATALQMAEEFRPDVILLDIGLPRMDGYEVARRLKANEHIKDALQFHCAAMNIAPIVPQPK